MVRGDGGWKGSNGPAEGHHSCLAIWFGRSSHAVTTKRCMMGLIRSSVSSTKEELPSQVVLCGKGSRHGLERECLRVEFITWSHPAHPFNPGPTRPANDMAIIQLMSP